MNGKHCLFGLAILSVTLLWLSHQTFAQDPLGVEPSVQEQLTPTIPSVTESAEPALIIQVEPAALTCADVIDFKDVEGGVSPGTNYDEILTSGAAMFAERFVGQTLGFSGNFDVLSGSPSDPLTLQVGDPNCNINVFTRSSFGNVLAGLGQLGFPWVDAIGEGSIAVLFDADQFEVGFTVVGNSGGTATINFFKGNGSLIHSEVLTLLLPPPDRQTFAFRRVDNIRDIAGISIHNDDPFGVAYDDFIVCEENRVSVDIKPQSCPNPLNTKSKGVLPVAVLGTASLDVGVVDPESLFLEGVAPLRWAYEDVATPFEPFLGKEDCGEDCNTEGPDGYMDLTLKFDTQEVVEVLGDVIDRENRVLTLSGELEDGTLIGGNDCVVILARGYQGIKAKGGKLKRLDFIDPSTIADTRNRPNDLIYGLIDMEIEVDKPGGTATVTVSLQSPAPPEFGWYKYSPIHGWYDYSAYAAFNADRDRVTFTLTDGSIGDDDGLADRRILDTSGLGITSVSDGDASSSVGDGGGCFISKVAHGATWRIRPGIIWQ